MGRSYESLNRKVERDEQGRRVTTHRPHAIKVEKCNAPGKYIVSVGSDTFVVRESRLKETVAMLETIAKLPDADRPHVELLDSGNVLIRKHGKQAYVSNAGDIADAIKALEPSKPTKAELDPEPIVPHSPGKIQRQRQAEHDAWQTRREAEAVERREAARDNKLAKMIKTFIESSDDNGAADEIDSEEIGQSHLDKIRRKHRAIEARSRHLKAKALLLDTDPTASLADKQAARSAWIESYTTTELPDDEVSRWLGEKPAAPPADPSASESQERDTPKE